MFVSYLVAMCYHCESPVCAAACLADAITKREDNGIVVVDTEACLGNIECKEKCRTACPYHAPQFGPEAGAKMRKCGFCLERWQGGKLPVCVESCPTRALDAGPLPEMEKKYGSVREASGF